MIVSLTRDRYINFSGESPHVTMRGIALVDNSDTLAILAIAVFSGQSFIVCGVKDGAKRKDIVKGWRKFKSEFMRENVDYYAIIDEEIATAPSFLKHFGFVHLKKDIYIFRG